MTSFLSGTCYLAFLAFAVLSPVLPLSLTWRSAALSAIALAAGYLLDGPVHGADQGLGYALGMAMLFFFVLAVGAALVLRLFVAGFMGYLTPKRLAGPTGGGPLSADTVILAAAGVAAGLAISIGLAHLLDGSVGGRPLDLFVACLAGAFAVFVRRRRVVGSAMLASGSFVVAAVALVGSFQSGRIVDGAEALAAGRPWCLVSPRTGQPVTKAGQLGFFSLPKGGGSGHLEVLVRDGAGFSKSHWSIRQQRFVSDRTASGATCLPRADYRDALWEGRIDPNSFATVGGVYSVPPSMLPVVDLESIAVSSGMLVGDGGKLPGLSRTIRMTLSPSEPYVRKDAKPLSLVAALGSKDLPSLTNGKGMDFSGTDPASGRRVAVSCLRGAYADQNCEVTATGEASAYRFMIPFNRVANWPADVDRVIALFVGMKVEE